MLKAIWTKRFRTGNDQPLSAGRWYARQGLGEQRRNRMELIGSEYINTHSRPGYKQAL